MKKQKHLKNKNNMGFQQWGLVAQEDTIVSVDGTAVNETISDYCTNNPDFQFEICDEGTGEGYLYNAVLVDTEIEIVFETAGGKLGVIIISGTRPTCA